MHALQTGARHDEAVDEFREELRLDPRFPASHLFIARALIEAGEPRAAMEALGGIEPGPPPDPFITPEIPAERAERLIALGPYLPAVIAGYEAPAGAEEAASFARQNLARGRPDAADLVARNRSQAARAAVRTKRRPNRGRGGVGRRSNGCVPTSRPRRRS